MDAATALRGLQRAVSTPFALGGVACALPGTVSKLCGWWRFTTVTENPGEEYAGASRVAPLGSLSRAASDAHMAGAGVNATSPFTMSETELQVTVDPLEGANEGISMLRLCRPAVRNALGRQLVRELNEAVDNLRQEPSTRCVVLASAVEGVFCAGADLKERKTMTQQETYEVVAGLRHTMSRVSELPMPVIAAVEGKAVGGGAELALACDIRVAGRAAQFSWPEAHVGIIPGAGGTQRLPRLVGPAAALELMLTARPVAAEEAHRIGLVQHVTEPGQALERALELGRNIKRGAPTALRMIKLAVHQGLGTDLRTGLKLEELCYDRVLPTQDRLEGLRAHAEKRAPLFTGN